MIPQAYKYVSSSLWSRLAFFELKISDIMKSSGWGLEKSELPWEQNFYGYCQNGYSKIWWDTSWHINRYEQINDTLFKQRITAGSGTDL